MASRDFSIAVLISTYNWPQALEVIFRSIQQQTVMPDELLIADDGSESETRRLVNRYRRILGIPVKHAWHEDKGFRKSLILNKAVRLSRADYIIEIDGDIMLHPRFVEDHAKRAERGTFVQGARVMVSERMTEHILSGLPAKFHFFSRGIRNRINAIRLPALSSLIRIHPQNSANTKGCNLAFWREDFIMVNGYNNLFQGWGAEDCEFAARLINAGVVKKRLKLASICYHLHHNCNSKSQQVINESRYQETVDKKIIVCDNGYAELEVPSLQHI